jgi:hypothetical protein
MLLPTPWRKRNGVIILSKSKKCGSHSGDYTDYVSYNVKPSTLEDRYQHSEEDWNLPYQTTWHHILKGTNLHSQCHENIILNNLIFKQPGWYLNFSTWLRKNLSIYEINSILWKIKHILCSMS